MAAQDEELVVEAIHAVLAKAPPMLVDLHYRLDADYSGDAAVYVTAVLADRPVIGDPYDGDVLTPIDDLVWDEFVKRGIERIPHVSFRQEHETVEESDPLEDAPAS